jgi:hypothetical protein
MSKFSGGVHPQNPLHSCVVYWLHTWPSAIAIPLWYIISQKGPFSKMPPPPDGKILKKGPAWEGKEDNFFGDEFFAKRISVSRFIHYGGRRHLFKKSALWRRLRIKENHAQPFGLPDWQNDRIYPQTTPQGRLLKKSFRRRRRGDWWVQNFLAKFSLNVFVSYFLWILASKE